MSGIIEKAGDLQNKKIAEGIKDLAESYGVETKNNKNEKNLELKSLEDIHNYLEEEALQITKGTLKRYHYSLASRGFVILAGTSGTGKTWLAQAYATAISAEHIVVPVAPNWTTNEDLLGYYNPVTDTYVHTGFSTFLGLAAEEYEKNGEQAREFHLILDEMNLARVEYYFSHFLSLLELCSRGEVVKLKLEKEVILPPNLKIIGTVNMDETTEGFADKIFDRAQLIEFELTKEDIEIYLKDDLPYKKILLEIWEIMSELAPFSFRVMNDIQKYIRIAEDDGFEWKESLDEQIVQKLLPKVKGNNPRLNECLLQLIKVCEENEFVLSYKKIQKMHEGYTVYGSCSYF